MNNIYPYYIARYVYNLCIDACRNLCKSLNDLSDDSLDEVIITDYNDHMRKSALSRNLDGVKLSFENNATNIEECLKIASEMGTYSIAEYLIEKGANPDIAIRYSKSNNIIRMAWRHSQRSEIIK
jgi:hypothetical protein